MLDWFFQRQTDCIPFVLPSSLQVDRSGDPGYLADHTGGVSMPGKVFRHIHISRPQTVDGAITQADFRLAGQGDDVLPSNGTPHP